MVFLVRIQFLIVVVLLYFDSMLMQMVMCLLLLDLRDPCLIRATENLLKSLGGPNACYLGECVFPFVTVSYIVNPFMPKFLVWLQISGFLGYV